MQIIIDLAIAIVCGILTLSSMRAVQEAERTGRLRLFFWHIPGWGDRVRNPGFFNAMLRMQYVRTIFFAVVTLVAIGAFFGDVGKAISSAANGS